MGNATRVPSSKLSRRIAVVTEAGTQLVTPFLTFATDARQVLSDFDAEAAALTDEQLHEAAEVLVPLHRLLEAMTDGFCNLLVGLGADEQAMRQEAAA
jgi:hypothetical protein